LLVDWNGKGFGEHEDRTRRRSRFCPDRPAGSLAAASRFISRETGGVVLRRSLFDAVPTPLRGPTSSSQALRTAPIASTSMLIRMKVCCRNRLHRVSSSVSGYTSHDLEAAVGCSADRERGCLMDRQFRLGPSRQCDLRSKGYRYFQRGDRTCTTAEPGLQLLGADATLCRTRVRLTNPSSHPSPAAWLWHRQGSVLA
jgi:hypothetical protein